MLCKFCQRQLNQVGCCGETGKPILVCHGCGSVKLCDQEQLPSALWALCRKLVASMHGAGRADFVATLDQIEALVGPQEGGPK